MAPPSSPALPTSPALPGTTDSHGSERLLGVEVEFGGLDEGVAARLLAEASPGAHVTREDSELKVSDTPFGTCKLYIDTTFRDRDDTALGRAALDLARNVVPVELVTEPFSPTLLPQLDALLDRYVEAGATGTRDGLFLGFGVHLNVQIASDGADHLWSVLTAFALAEPLLRDSYAIDLSRRALPFVDPYPARLADTLCMGAPGSVEALAQCYFDATTSRNHALDMLPIFSHLVPDMTRNALAHGAGGTVSARPAYHYRMPDCRIDEPRWSLVGEWSLWCAIEALAEDRRTLMALCDAWQEMRQDPLRRMLAHSHGAHGWIGTSAGILEKAGHDDLRRIAGQLTA